MEPRDDAEPTAEELLEEFRLALALEEKAADTYRELASDCDDTQARIWLLELSRQELKHARIARRLVRLAEGATLRPPKKIRNLI